MQAGTEGVEIRLPVGESIRGRVLGIPQGSRGGILRVVPAKDGTAPAVPWQSGTFVGVAADGSFTTAPLESGSGFSGTSSSSPVSRRKQAPSLGESREREAPASKS